jgi:N-ethylmaleimide reductase
MTNTNDLFTPVRVGSLLLQNRVLMAPMTRSRAGKENVPVELNVKYYEQRASAGLIITEATQVSPRGVGYPSTPGIHTDAQVEGWRRVTDAVHARGGRIFLQLWHVGRVSHPSLQPDGELPVAPSAIAPEGTVFTYEGPKPFVTPRALALDEIPGIVREFAEGARRAKDANFDGVEIHGANGYLIEQFLYDSTNHRTDAYGGSIENRARLLLEITEAVCDVWGGDRVGVRISPRGTFNSMHTSDREGTARYVAGALNRFNLAYLHVVEQLAGNGLDTPDAEPRLTPVIRELFQGPLVVNGGYDRETAEEAITRGAADAVAFGVPFLANPDLPERLREGAPLNEPDHATFYGGDGRGYTDYPTREALEVATGA